MRINSERSFAYVVPLLCCLLLSGAVLAPSNHTVGLGVYALQAPHFPCDSAIKVAASSKRPALAVLWHTFGDDTKCVKKFLSRPGPKALEIHLVNEVCAKNHRCGKYEFLSGVSTGKLTHYLRTKDRHFLSRFRRYSVKIHTFIKPYLSNTQCFISPLLESSQRDKEGAVLVDLTRQIFPECKVVWSPLYPASHAHADLLEGHGRTPHIDPPCIANLDGVGLTGSSLEAWLKRFKACEVRFLWKPSFNLNRPVTAFHDPRERSIRPSRSELLELTRYLRDE